MDYTCGIVEVDPLAETILRKYIERISFLEISWVHSFPEHALSEEPVDLLFANLREISVPADDSFLHLTQRNQRVVVMSTYSKEVWRPLPNVIAYLEKPFSFETFVQTLELFLEKYS